MNVLKKDIIQELTTRMRDRTGHDYITQVDAAAAYECFLDIISDALANGNEVHMKGFGTFCTIQVAARGGYRNVHTGEAVTLPAGKRLRFRPSQDLKTRAEAEK